MKSRLRLKEHAGPAILWGDNSITIGPEVTPTKSLSSRACRGPENTKKREISGIKKTRKSLLPPLQQQGGVTIWRCADGTGFAHHHLVVE